MSASKPPGLEPSLEALVRTERERPGSPPDAQAALWARLETTLALPPTNDPGAPDARPTAPRTPRPGALDGVRPGLTGAKLTLAGLGV
ncbi:MAG TPA: hypothetical protein VHB21_06040, partial [Minicystis sp.]|nr:hypothetical protein [Minicystis sp.]